jgi:hypothetical protein
MGSEISAREPAGRAAERAGGAARSHQAPVPAGLSAAGCAVDPQDGQAKRVREWLFLLLCFAITRDTEDELAVLMMANGMDLLGRQWGRPAPTFFRHSSDEVCKAKKHIRRIEHLGLRRAFEAAVHSEVRAPQAPDRSNQPDLWAGLRR